MATEELTTEVHIPCDVQQEDETGYVWAFLDEARDPSRIVVGAIVVSGDEVDPVLARVVSLTERPGGTKVHLEILPGDPPGLRRRPPPITSVVGVMAPVGAVWDRPVPSRPTQSHGILTGFAISGPLSTGSPRFRNRR